MQIPFLIVFSFACGICIGPWFLGVFIVNWAYNFGPRLSSRYAPLDLFCPCGYLLVVPLSSWLNKLPLPPPRTWIHCLLLVLRSQLWIQTFDIEPDRAAGVTTPLIGSPYSTQQRA